jgi:hypothetical protein
VSYDALPRLAEYTALEQAQPGFAAWMGKPLACFVYITGIHRSLRLTICKIHVMGKMYYLNLNVQLDWLYLQTYRHINL